MLWLVIVYLRCPAMFRRRRCPVSKPPKPETQLVVTVLCSDFTVRTQQCPEDDVFNYLLSFFSHQLYCIIQLVRRRNACTMF